MRCPLTRFAGEVLYGVLFVAVLIATIIFLARGMA